MPLHILLILVIGGIGGIAILLHYLGLSSPRIFDGPEDATRQWLREFPDDEVVEVILNHRGTTGFVQTHQGPGLVWSFGADTVARRLHDFNVTPKKRGLRIDFHDFGAPHMLIPLDDFETSHWENLLRTA